MLTTLAYVGPETMVPLMSVLAAAGGAMLFFWRWILRFMTTTLEAVGLKKKRERVEAPAAPMDAPNPTDADKA